jgi:hypothetical protein
MRWLGNQSAIDLNSFTASRTFAGSAPAVVDFSASATSVLGASNIMFRWWFGDGAVEDTTAPFVSHLYMTEGSFSASVTVLDLDGTMRVDSTPLVINIGIPPVVTILEPLNGDTFVAGQRLTLRGTATDLFDTTLGPDQFTWSILYRHDTHFHPGFDDLHFFSTQLEIPTSGHDFSGDVGLVIKLTVKNSHGVSGTQQVQEERGKDEKNPRHTHSSFWGFAFFPD